MMSNSLKRYQNKTENVIIKLYNPTLKEELSYILSGDYLIIITLLYSVRSSYCNFFSFLLLL